jgi:hypothetical protein
MSAKKTSDIVLTNWTTIQQRATATNQLGDNAPSDDLEADSTPGPHLVFENGIWKYPQQDECGRFSINKAARVMYIMADLGADSSWAVRVKDPINETGSPYPSDDAELYEGLDIIIASGTGERFVSQSLRDGGVVLPGQYVYVTTTGGDEPLVRLTFAPLYDLKGY